jgi:hypothetical protein
LSLALGNLFSWKLGLVTDAKIFSIISQLWSIGFKTGGSKQGTTVEADAFKEHPFGSFNPNKGYAYIDRVGYRIPTHLSESVGNDIAQQTQQKGGHENANSKPKRPRPLQRSLTPHLDCCPHTLISNDAARNESSKWRPLQSFVSLTDNLKPNTGGFVAAPRFHRQFTKWAISRAPSFGKINKNGGRKMKSGNELCKGAFTPLRPEEDANVLEQMQHIPCRAGSFVVWDNRIPHGNARRNDNPKEVREVIYVSFLPADVPQNQKYVEQQLKDYKEGNIPTDQWIEAAGRTDKDKKDCFQFSALGRKLMGIDPW